jgi:capsular exopolysaccharide synthesis family protein
MVGIGAVFFVDRMDQRIHSIKEFRSVLGLPVLAQISRVRPDQLEELDEIGLLCDSQPRSLLAEEYRSIRTNIDFLRRNRRIQVILITSPHSGDGKSTSASNFAISLAQTGRKVLLIDADLRKPSLHRIHHLPNSVGMTDLLTDRLSDRDVVKKTHVATLDLVTAGHQEPNPAELLTSSRLNEFIDRLRDLYEFVIVDSPPILAVTDPAILSTVTDGVVLVVRADKLRHHDAEATLERIESLGAAVLGMIVNGTSQENVGYAYGYGDGPRSSNGSSRVKAGNGVAHDESRLGARSEHPANGHASSTLNDSSDGTV